MAVCFRKGPSSMAGVATNIAAAPSLKSFKASGSHFWNTNTASQAETPLLQGLPENSNKSTGKDAFFVYWVGRRFYFEWIFR